MAKDGVTPVLTVMAADRDFGIDLYDDFNDSHLPWTGATCPPCMYGSSYIRTYLNQKGKYSFWYSNYSGYAFTSWNSNNNNANITALLSGYSEVMLSPSNVAWQENQENAKVTLNADSRYLNENYGTEPTDDWTRYMYNVGAGFNYGYAYEVSTAYYGTWKDDLLWLPSLTELGSDSDRSGAWGLSTAQRQLAIKSAGKNWYYWTRSGCPEFIDSDNDGGVDTMKNQAWVLNGDEAVKLYVGNDYKAI